MHYYTNEDGDLVIVQDDDEEYRNATFRDHRRGRPRPRPRTYPPYNRPHRPPSRPRPPGPEYQPQSVIVRPSPSPQAPVVVEQPMVKDSPDYGIHLGGVKLGAGPVLGVLATLAGLALQVGSHFVEVPDAPEGDALEVGDVASYQKDKNKADRTIRLLETVGRGLSDAGQLVAFKGLRG